MESCYPARRTAAVFAAAILGLPSVVRAHDLWIERAPGGFVLRAGHPDAPQEVDPAKVTSIRCLRESSPPADVRARAVPAGPELRILAACDAVVACVDHGSWTLTPDGEVNRPRTQVADAVKSWQSRACAKWVDPRSPVADRPAGAELELVPVKPLASARRGDKIALRVLEGGAPVNGAVVAIGHHVIGETDHAGEVRVRLREPGLQVLAASLRKPVHTADADALVLEATLAFEVVR